LHESWDAAGSIAVCEDGKLVGLIRIEDVLAGPKEARAADLMDADPPIVAPGWDQEAAAWTAVHRGESTLAVVDEEGRFAGLVPADRLLAVLLAEHDEDLARLGGFLKGASLARMTSRERVAKRFWHRLPWLMIGLAGAFAAAGIVGSFERQLEDNVILAFFLPGVIYMADAVGTQTETLIVRGLSVGIPIREVVRREVLTGLLVGTAVAVVFIPVALWRWGESDVVTAVAIALFAACSTATGVAMALPWALHRLGLDPAFGSGPLATVIQDLLSVLIYFAVAVNLVH
jgi:magnesium transporter